MTSGDKLASVGMALLAGLVALFILSTRSCTVDGHHEHTKQVEACVAHGGTWHDTSDQYESGDHGYCEHAK